MNNKAKQIREFVLYGNIDKHKIKYQTIRRFLILLSVSATTYQFLTLLEELANNDGQWRTVYAMFYFAWLSLMLKR